MNARTPTHTEQSTARWLKAVATTSVQQKSRNVERMQRGGSSTVCVTSYIHSRPSIIIIIIMSPDTSKTNTKCIDYAQLENIRLCESEKAENSEETIPQQ